MKGGAQFSSDRKHRYSLYRTWDHNKAKVMFIMLNPSIADEHHDSKTMLRCIEFAKSWGFGGLMVGNLFSFVSQDPKGLLENSHQLFDIETRRSLRAMANDCGGRIVLAWGHDDLLQKLFFKEPMLRGIIQDTLESIETADTKFYAIELSLQGVPKHPLFLRKYLAPTLIETLSTIKNHS